MFLKYMTKMSASYAKAELSCKAKTLTFKPFGYVYKRKTLCIGA